MGTVSSIANQDLINKYIEKQKAKEASEKAPKNTDKTNLIGKYDTFLKILTAQIKNQDPTEPMDAGEFTNQLVQYSSVEQMINVNTKLDRILTNQNPNGITPLLGYVGQYTETASDGTLVVQNNKAMMSYNLPSNISSVSVSIQDQKGNVLAKIEGPAESGLNRVVWDGVLKDGKKAPDGLYKCVLTAKNASGEAVPIKDIRAIGQVTGVETDNAGKVVLKIGDLSVKDSDIKSVFGSIAVNQNTSNTTSG